MRAYAWDLHYKLIRAKRKVERGIAFFPFAWERIRRGYSESDTWSFDIHLAEVIVGGVRKLREREFGYPGDLTPEEWNAILLEIEEGFQCYLDDNNSFILHGFNHEKEVKIERAWDLLHHWFQALWD